MNSELEGAELNAAVAKLEGEPVEVCDGKAVHPRDLWPYQYDYSTDWGSGGRIIERERLMIQPLLVNGDWHGEWRAVALSWEGREHADCTGPTPLVAAMRAYVNSMPANV